MMVDELSSHERRIIGLIDERPQLLNRTLNGYSIVGMPEDLPKIIDEYATHGVEVRRIVVAADAKDLTEETRQKIRTICQARHILIDWLHETFVGSLQKAPRSAVKSAEKSARTASLSPYWKIKRALDIVVAFAVMITLAPLTMLIAAIVLIDVGFPIVFWQQRIGQHGRRFHLYKFRTMRSDFDRKSQPVPRSERLSVLGRLLRANHVDEIPQLFNVLAGDMSLVGPRPLLPVDQPLDAAARLQVRPGLTGLAQVNGGTSLSADEKNAVDEWYIRHASLWLDMKIMLRTFWVVVRDNPRNENLISTTFTERRRAMEGLFSPSIPMIKDNLTENSELGDILVVRPR
jgi:lipopolysaccharide/colanic/teichoic acid biosynthesis glycosyltransferase